MTIDRWNADRSFWCVPVMSELWAIGGKKGEVPEPLEKVLQKYVDILSLLNMLGNSLYYIPKCKK